MNPDDERWLRDTLDDAVRDVEPRRGLDDIAASVRSRPRRVAPWVATGAGLLVAATVGGIALAGGLWSDEPQASPAGPATTSAPEPSPSSEASEDAAGEPGVGSLPVYYVGDTPAGPRLYREFRAPASDGDALAVAVDMAVSVDPLDPDYRVPWPEGTTASARASDPGVVVVELDSEADLALRPAGMSADEARLAIQQLVHTAQAAAQERVKVGFIGDGQPMQRLLGADIGLLTSEDDPMAVQAPVWIIDPHEGKRTDGRLRVEGRGAFFEANVSWQVLDPETGRVVSGGGRSDVTGYATAQECCTLSPFSFTLPQLPPGDYVLRVYDADMSGGEGPGEQEDTKSFTVDADG